VLPITYLPDIVAVNGNNEQQLGRLRTSTPAPTTLKKLFAALHAYASNRRVAIDSIIEADPLATLCARS